MRIPRGWRRLDPTRSIRVRIMCAVAASGIAIAALLVAYIQWRLEHALTEAARVALSATATVVESRLDSEIASSTEELSILGEGLRSHMPAPLESLRPLLDDLRLHHPSYAWFGVIDPGGRVVAATGGLMQNAEVSDQAWFKAGLRDVHMSGAAESPLLPGGQQLGRPEEPRPFIALARPLRQGKDGQGETVGVLAAWLDFRWVQSVVTDALQTTPTGRTAAALIADRDGVLLVKPVGETATRLAELAADAAPAARHLTVRLEAAPSSPMAQLGWTLLLRQPREQAFSALSGATDEMLMLVGAGLVLLAAIAWPLSRRFARPIVDLAAAARRYHPETAKPFEPGIGAREDEIGTLTEVLSKLVDTLRLRGDQFRQLIEHAPVPLAMLDRDMRYLAASAKWRVIFAAGKQDILGRSHYEVLAAFPDHWRAANQRALGGEVVASDGELVEWPVGTPRWLRWEARPWFQPDGTSGGIILFAEDITERKRAEAALVESEASFRGFFDNASVGATQVAPDGRYAKVNDHFCEMTGYRREELVERLGPLDLTHPEDRDADRPRIARLRAGQGNYEAEKRYLRKNGEAFWVRVTAAPVRGAGGEVLFTAGVVVDMSAQKEAQAALEGNRRQLETFNTELASQVASRTAQLVRARNYFRGFIQQAPFAICVVEGNGQIVLRNAEFLRVLGYDQDEAPTLEECWRLVYPDPSRRAEVVAHWRRITCAVGADGSAIAPFETRATCADGRVRQLEVSGVRLDNSLLVTFIDVTDRNEAQAALLASRDEAESASRAKSDFLANISHDIRTPMNAILGSALLLERSVLPEPLAQHVHTIRAAGRSMMALINDVLDLSKIEAGRMELDQSPFVLRDVLDTTLDVFRDTAANKGVALECAPLPADMPELIGDARRLGQILSNLIGNAVKFTSRGAVSVAVRAVGDGQDVVPLRFCVRDTGMGIPADQTARLFEAFYQAGRSVQRHYGGTGLGLSICRHLVEAMGGVIGVDSEPGVGSEFWFEVPFHTALYSPIDQPGCSEQAAVQRLAGMRVLVVDDSAVNRDIAVQLLALEGARCEQAGDGREALERLCAGPQDFDLVLMDVQMRDMDGLQVTRAMRRRPGLADLPVIALTAGALPSQRKAAMAAGMNEFVTKPFDLERLVAAVLQVLPQPSGRRARAAAVAEVSPGLAEAPFPAIRGIDTAQAAQRLGGDRRLFHSILRAVREEFADVVDRTRADLAAGARASAMARMHKLAGVAGNLSAGTIAALARQLEASFEGASLVDEERLLGELDRALAELIAELPADIDLADPGAETAAGAASDVIEPEEMAGLKDALARGNARALKLYRALEPRLRARLGAPGAAPLARAMEQMRFNDALATLRSWYPS